MTPVIVPRVARLNSQSPASLGERNGSSSAIWKIAAVAVLALSWRAAETALRRNRNRRKCTTKRSVSSMPAVEQTAKTLRPSVAQTPEIAPALAPTGLSGPFTTTTEAPSEIPARTEEIALPAVVTPAETEVGSRDGGEPMAYETTFTAIQSPAAEAITES